LKLGDLSVRRAHVHDHEVNEILFRSQGQGDQSNPKVQEWENLMWRFQQSCPGEPGKMAADGKDFRVGELSFFLL